MNRILKHLLVGATVATTIPLALVSVPRIADAAGLGTIEGSVIDQAGNVKATGVRITIKCGGVTRAAPVNGAGQFRVDGLPEGTCTVTAVASGLQTITYRVNLAANSIATVLVRMAPPAPPPDMSKAEPTVVAPSPAEAPAPRPAKRIAAKPMGGAGAVAATPPKAPPPPPPPPMLRAEAKKEPRAVGARRIDRDDRAGIAAQDAWAGDEELGEAVAYAPVRVFPVPQYTKAYDGPRTDFRETIYWNPSVETDAAGNAEVTFVTSDAVTAFAATVEGISAGGAIGGGTASIRSKLPLALDAHLPVEVTSGDTIRLPITITNETSDPIEGELVASFGAAFKVSPGFNGPSGKLRLAAGEKKSLFVPLEVVAASADGAGGAVKLALSSRGLRDEIEKTIRIVPRGFPFTASASGTVKGEPGQPGSNRHELDLAGALPGSVTATVTMYPSPLASMTKGMDAMIREPGGCFEQTSSTNYPNIMILGYLQSNDAADAALVGKTQGVLDKGYKLLTGYETKQRGYEWFGNTPGHEALTAYGLMEFADMAKVYDVDPAMVSRTADWLMSRRDGKGGFQRSSQALDSFGRASEATTNAYIMWALAEAQRTKGLDVELAAQRTLGATTTDPYLLALATNTALIAAPSAPETAAMVKKLVAMQGKDGAFAGAKESITMSGGEALAIEATSLATLAMLKATKVHGLDGQIRAAVDYLNGKRSGYGQWGNTQATVLGLKALTAYAEHARQMQASGTATLLINGQVAGAIPFEKGRKEALVWDDLATKLRPGKNTFELRLDGEAALPYTITVEYRSNRPQSSANAKVAVATQLVKTQARMGEGVTLRAHVENKTAAGVPMTLARIGIPGGMTYQTWQLKELRDKGLVDFYETRPREVILYWRALPPSAKKSVDLNLLSKVPGTYEAPASSAYLYYTAEDKAWSAPVKIAIDR